MQKKAQRGKSPKNRPKNIKKEFNIVTVNKEKVDYFINGIRMTGKF